MNADTELINNLSGNRTEKDVKKSFNWISD